MNTVGPDLRSFILWDPNGRDGRRPPTMNGELVTSGLMGPLGLFNVYLVSYAVWPDARRPEHLQVGECIAGVRFSLGGSTGLYDVYRVE